MWHDDPRWKLVDAIPTSVKTLYSTIAESRCWISFFWRLLGISIGASPTERDGATGLGLLTLSQRKQLINNKYPDAAIARVPIGYAAGQGLTLYLLDGGTF
jgi:hypothetical protein